jgi:NAD+ kinase
VLAAELQSWLEADGHEVARVTDEAPGRELDLAVSIGGDGTMLRAVRLVSHSGTPVLGVNVGHLGYLTEVEPAACRAALEQFFAGDYRVEERMRLDIAAAGCEPLTALNDAVVEKLESGHTVRVGVNVGGRPVIRYATDALIVATPTGSTAYNLSAGGPLLSPQLRATLITPVAAHSLMGRSLIVAGDELVRIEIVAGSAVLNIDGRACARLQAGDAIEARAGAQPARLVTFGARDVWSIVKAKFGLDGD